MCQAREVCGHACVWLGNIFCLFSRLFLLNFKTGPVVGHFFLFSFYNIRNMLIFWLETSRYKQTLENTDWAIKNGQSRETGNIGHTRHRKETNKAQSRKQKSRCVKKSGYRSWTNVIVGILISPYIVMICNTCTYKWYLSDRNIHSNIHFVYLKQFHISELVIFAIAVNVLCICVFLSDIHPLIHPT